MKRYIPHIVISLVALLVAAGHILLPSAKIDAITLALLLIAVLPWLGFIFKSVEFPGGLKVEYQDLQKVREAAAMAGLLSASPSKIEDSPLYLSLADQDPNLALAGLRIEIERRLREIARKQGLQGERLGVGQLLQLLRLNEVISSQEGSILGDLIGLLNKAVHGAEVDSRALEWAIDVGPRLLSALDERISA